MRLPLEKLAAWLLTGVLAGALIGGSLLFGVSDKDRGLGAISVALEDLIAAICRSLVFLAVLRW